MVRHLLTLLNKRPLLLVPNSLLSNRQFHATYLQQDLFKKHPYHLFEPLRQYAPVFPMKGSQIQPLYQPSDFYKELKTRILLAKQRIFIAALYIGQSEKELVDTIRQALSQSKQLQVHILIDCLRGTRTSKGESSATLLTSLLQEYPNQVQVSMYHTPDLKGVLKRTLPPRFNESIGLMHLKVYGFDDTVMLSGANLSTDYFTNRQDRYILFHDKQLTNYYQNLLKIVGTLSYQLTDKGYMVMPIATADPVRHSQQYKRQARERLLAFIDRYNDITNKPTIKSTVDDDETNDTVVLPVIQMGPFGIRQDEKVTLSLLEITHRHGISNAESQHHWWTIHLTSGYFNFTDRYKQFILNTQAKFKFLTASPEANGFFNSKGVSRFLPPAYTHIERQFYRQVVKVGKEKLITIEEYKRPGWTYHAKGLWVSFARKTWPSLTMVGSPNFGHRSSQRDLEAQALVVTENKPLQQALFKEVDMLHQYSEPVSKETFQQQDRRVPYGVRVATSIVKTML
ncbi:uncharacterized protein BX664DRAFT_319510 [Halteromyces radiatus]|uniref:uncharacterized protein n=1 Tax=Halteromyces radiatus TaxID=101107 RepID=UPI002220497F|nr:uncharacterized protein BX664DRAFT_319510 [Halteromyces radiatus]KAI8098751.1 hypothetical protein BX664DRAFT_319510 [Halteromyces radiatus]